MAIMVASHLPPCPECHGSHFRADFQMNEWVCAACGFVAKSIAEKPAEAEAQGRAGRVIVAEKDGRKFMTVLDPGQPLEPGAREVVLDPNPEPGKYTVRKWSRRRE